MGSFYCQRLILQCSEDQINSLSCTQDVQSANHCHANHEFYSPWLAKLKEFVRATGMGSTLPVMEISLQYVRL